MTIRVCPKCGYEDPLEWRNLPHQLFMEYMRFDDFERLYPELAAHLKENPKLIFDEFNAYHLTKKGFVHRLPKTHCLMKNGEAKWNWYSSCYCKPKDPFQRKLLEVSQK